MTVPVMLYVSEIWIIAKKQEENIILGDEIITQVKECAKLVCIRNQNIREKQ